METIPTDSNNKDTDHRDLEKLEHNKKKDKMIDEWDKN